MTPAARSDRTGPRRREGTAIRPIVLVTLILLAAAPAARAQAPRRTDVIVLVNGDHLTAEVKNLDRGQLQARTDNLGTVYIKWEKVVGLVATRRFDVRTEDGRQFIGSLAASPARTVTVVTADGPVPLAIDEVTEIAPLGSNFWRRLDGSLDLGYTYTRSSGVSQFNFSLDTTLRRPSFTLTFDSSSSLTRTNGEDPGSRSTASFSYLGTRHKRWHGLGSFQFERNESMGLSLRSVVTAGAGYAFVNTNRAQFFVGGGLSGNEEQGVDVPAVTNIEAAITSSFSFYTYDFPKTSFDFTVTDYPSLSDTGRNRLQLDTSISRELFRDFSVSASFYDSYDNRPPATAAVTNDFGVVTSIGWRF